MKYLKDALLKSKAIVYTIVNIMITIVYTIINARILIWISSAISNAENDPTHWVNLVIIGCVANTILTYAIRLTNRTRSYIYTYLLNVYVDKILSADYQMFAEFSPGKLLTVQEMIGKLSSLVKTYLSVLTNVVNFAINMIAVWFIAPIFILPIIVIYSIIGYFVMKALQKWGEIDRKADDIMHKRNAEVDEIINGFAEVRSFPGNAKFHRESIHQQNYDARNIVTFRLRESGVLNVIANVGDSMMTIALLLYIIFSIQHGNVGIGSVGMSLIMYAWRMIVPFTTLLSDLDELSEYKAPIPKFEEIMNYRNTVTDGPIELDSFEREIRFKNVKFAYRESSNVLNGVNLTIRKGQHVGICGTSGGGKSTLLKLIPKFYDVTHGKILIDGINLKDLSNESIRKHIGIVHQDTFIFDATIADNIRYARRGSVVTDNEIIEACKKACLYDFVMSLPDTFDTNVGPRGLTLSGGQKQRISLARLFIQNPDIIILDEATSALDNETERVVQDSLNMFSEKTMIVVAHRLTTIEKMDKIIVIDQHKVAESGTHDELMRRGGLYASMHC